MFVYLHLLADGVRLLSLWHRYLSCICCPDGDTIQIYESNPNSLFCKWQQCIEQWKVVLDTIAEEFKAGVATVNPHKGAQTCNRCHLMQVCRINEAQYA